jgi:hypothetical protein
LEALACGCQVFSSLNHGLSDYLDPGFNCYKIAGYALEYDLDRILNILKSHSELTLPASSFETYRPPSLLPKLETILTEIDRFFDYKNSHQPDIESLTAWRIKQLWFDRKIAKIRQKLFKTS